MSDSNKTELANPPPWLKLALATVARMAALLASWDSYGSPPLSETARQNAVQLLASIEYEDFPAPCIVPISGGGLQIEWQDNRRELELEIVAGSHEVLFLKVHEDDSAEEGVFSITDRSTLQALLDWLLVRSISMTETIISKNSVPIRLTDERWVHITEEHNELAGMRLEVLETVGNPTQIFAGNSGELLAMRESEPGKYLVVVYREGENDGFIITAFLTRRAQSFCRRTQLWSL